MTNAIVIVMKMGKVKSNNKMLEKMAKAEAEKDGK